VFESLCGFHICDWPVVALGGGLVAIITLQIRRRFSPHAIVLWATMYVIFVVHVVATT
jgi:hypothetical protein